MTVDQIGRCDCVSMEKLPASAATTTLPTGFFYSIRSSNRIEWSRRKKAVNNINFTGNLRAFKLVMILKSWPKCTRHIHGYTRAPANEAATTTSVGINSGCNHHLMGGLYIISICASMCITAITLFDHFHSSIHSKQPHTHTIICDYFFYWNIK